MLSLNHSDGLDRPIWVRPTGSLCEERGRRGETQKLFTKSLVIEHKNFVSDDVFHVSALLSSSCFSSFKAGQHIYTTLKLFLCFLS